MCSIVLITLIEHHVNDVFKHVKVIYIKRVVLC